MLCEVHRSPIPNLTRYKKLKSSINRFLSYKDINKKYAFSNLKSNILYDIGMWNALTESQY